MKKEKIYSCFEDLLTGKKDKVTNLERKFISKDGITKWYLTSASIIKNKKGENQFIISTLNEITENKNLQSAIKQENHSYRVAIEALNASSILAFTDKKGIITYVNNKFTEISEYSKQELIGKTHSILNSGFHTKDFFKNLWDTINSKKIWKGEICNRTKSGKIYWVDTTIVPMLDMNGDIEQFVAIRYDVTQRKNAESFSLHSAKLASLGEMAGNIAHEINNPLSIIHGKAEALYNQLNNNSFTVENGLKNLERILFTTKRIAKVIRGLKSFSRNGDKDSFVTTNLDDIIENVLSMSIEKFNSMNIKIDVDKDSTIFISCRAVQIEQVLLNLLSNAYDAISELNEKWIKINITQIDNNVKISVIDSGKGISPQIIGNLMQPFYTTKGIGKGTGLGLSISKKIAEEHDGKLLYDNSCGNTCFTLVLPVKVDSKVKI